MRGSGCPLCELLLEAMQSYKNKDSDPNDPEECYLEWDLDGPHVEPSDKFVNDSRRLRMFWTRKATVEGYQGKSDKREEVYFIHAPSTSQHRLLNDETRSTATPAELVSPTWDDDSYPQSVHLILKWLNLCETTHKTVHPLSQGVWLKRFRQLVKSTSLGVIDVEDKKLCALPLENEQPARFAALSYVWGPNAQETYKSLWTTRHNVLSRVEKNGLEGDWDRFPKTIQDAIQLVKSLNEKITSQDPNARPFRYIWIDLLCIVQDSRRSWRTNAENMALIYGNAHLTICAADGDSADAGLLALNNSLRDKPLQKQIKPDLRLLVSKSSESIIDASEWNQRAWTFQERILSWRCVVFAGKRVYFQCRQTNLSQDDNPVRTGNGMSSAWRISPLRALAEIEHRPIQFYMNAVASYTGRNLSHPEDILNAFRGVSQLMEQYLGADVHFGLPTSHFDLALLWSPLSGKLRRKPENLERRKGIGLPDEKSARDERWADLEFPSWSWSGWMDSVNPGKGARVLYDLEFLDGCLTNLQDWLLNRTWITWYVRDKNGYVRPLWGGVTVPPSGPMEAAARQWKGYKSRPQKGPHWVKYLTEEESRAGGEHDDYGRPLNSLGRRHVKGEQTVFKQLLPDHPFGVRGPDHSESKSYMIFGGGNDYISFGGLEEDQKPYQPILQFWTLRCDLYIVEGNRGPTNGLQRFHVADRHGDRCGTAVVDHVWAEKNRKNKTLCTFIALSEAKSFTRAEWDAWTHYMPGTFEDSQWCLFYAMLITKDPERQVWERVGLGKVFQAAFRNNAATWEEILLG